jgi:sulfofructose kinase
MASDSFSGMDRVGAPTDGIRSDEKCAQNLNLLLTTGDATNQLRSASCRGNSKILSRDFGPFRKKFPNPLSVSRASHLQRCDFPAAPPLLAQRNVVGRLQRGSAIQLNTLQVPQNEHVAGLKIICLPWRLAAKIIGRAARLFLACAPLRFPYSVSVPDPPNAAFDILGVGLNATDTLIRLPRFPAFNSKVEFRVSEVLPGGQVATAVTACARWGLRARYVGKIGDDDFGRLQQEEMKRAGIEAHWVVVPKCQSQSSFILVDEASGERTVLWKRDPRLELLPAELPVGWIRGARLLHVDGHDCAAAAAAARLARDNQIPVTADLDNRYPGVEALLENVDYAVTSEEFPARLTNEGDLFSSLPSIASRFGCRFTAATLGADGVLAWDGSTFLYSPAFDVRPIDTTGAGDVFHAAFAFALLRDDDLSRALEFSNAAAGLSCLGLGARGGICSLPEIERFVRESSRRPSAYTQEQLEAARALR